MIRPLRLLPVPIARCSRSRLDLLLENLALRQQLVALKHMYPRPRVAVSDKLFWVLLRRFWPGWKQALIFVQPETVVRLAPGRIQVVFGMAFPALNSGGQEVRQH
jgi:hypothetical protein